MCQNTHIIIVLFCPINFRTFILYHGEQCMARDMLKFHFHFRMIKFIEFEIRLKGNPCAIAKNKHAFPSVHPSVCSSKQFQR